MITAPGKSRLAAVATLTAMVALVACGPVVAPSPSSSAPEAASLDAPTASPTTSAAAVEQTDTEWGRIWDGVPAWFPIYPGATLADDVATEVVSATFAIAGTDPRTVIGWTQAELEGATYPTEALNGPFEDGSFVLDSVGTGDCRIQVSAAPAGGLTTVSVRYGAACPGGRNSP